MAATKPLYERAVEYVLSMPKTERQMRLWLARKSDGQTQIDEIVERLKSGNLIDDAEYARTLVSFKKDKLGAGVIKNKLRTAGVESGLIDRLIDDVGDQRELALQKMEKYMHNKERTPENRSKLFRWLLSKGFGFELCGEVINENWNRH